MARLLMLLSSMFGAMLPAPQRLLQPGDLQARATAATLIGFGLHSGVSLHAEAGRERLLAALATARECLPLGSAARAGLDDLLQRDVATKSLASAAAALRDDLTFQPVAQAALPAGLPGFQALDELELRHYPAYRMVRSDMRGGSMGAFWPLFQHIQQHDIAMTTPVQIDYRGDGEAARQDTMAFLFGKPELGPVGPAGKVEVVDVPAMTVITVGSRGYDQPSRVAELRQRLEVWIAANPQWQAAWPMRTMNYNSPMVGVDRRYFEVQIPVRRPAVARERSSI